MKAGMNLALEQRVRATPRRDRRKIEAVAVTGESTKDTQAEFAAADSFTGFEHIDGGGVRLSSSNITFLDQTVHDSNLTDLDNVSPFVMARVDLGGSETPDLVVRRVTVRLNPNTGAGQQVVWWQCQLWILGEVDDDVRVLVPLGTAVEVAAGVSEADVLFNFSSFVPLPHPKMRLPGGDGSITTPVLYVQIKALKADGSAAANVAWRKDSTVQTFGSGNTITFKTLTQLAGETVKFSETSPGIGVPRLKIETGSYASATLAFTGAGNKPDVGSVPGSASDVRFVVKVAPPSGTSLTAQFRVGGADAWITAKDGQTAADVGLAASQTYQMQLITAPNTAADATPIIYRAGAEIIKLTDLTSVATLGDVNWAIDPWNMRAEVAQSTLAALHDGEPDYRDAITQLLSENKLKDLTIRVHVGADDLSRDQWMLLGEYVIDETFGLGPNAELVLASPIVQMLRQVLPVPTGVSPNIKRVPLVYTNQTLKAASNDILDNQLALPGRWRGPGIENTTDLVTKTIKDSSVKHELERLAFIDGGSWIESQGRIKYVSLHGDKAVVKIFDRREIKQGKVSPGWSRRTPEVFMKYAWNWETGEHDKEAKVRNQPALDALGIYGSAAPAWIDDEIGQWIVTDALGKSVVERQATVFGSGEITIPFQTIYAFPEVELGDLVAVPTDRFMAKDPIAGRVLRGQLYAICVLVGIHDWDHTIFTGLVRGFADILGTGETVTRKGYTEGVVSAYAEWIADKMQINYRATSDIGSVKWATSTTDFPAAGTGTTVDGASGVIDAGTGFTYNQGRYVTLTPYTEAAAGGVQLPAYKFRAVMPWEAAQWDATTGKRKRAGQFDDGGYALRAADTAGKEAFDDVYVLNTKTVKVGTVASPATLVKTFRIQAAEFQMGDDSQLFSQQLGYIRRRQAAGTLDMIAPVNFAPGVKITEFRAHMYRNAVGDTATMKLYRVTGDGVATQIGTTATHGTTGWSTVAITGLSETVDATNSYCFIGQLISTSGVDDARLAWVEPKYEMATYVQSL